MIRSLEFKHYAIKLLSHKRNVMSEFEQIDAMVIGANTRGLVATYILSSLGYTATLVDRSKSVGGADGSFAVADGTRFEFGMHVLDEMRSPVATRLFTNIVDGRINRVKLNRAIVLCGQMMPYSPKPQDMPDQLRQKLSSDDIVDELGDQPPTRDNLARYYGQEYANVIFDEVLPSYPTENRHRKFGVDESELIANIYPWFFPRARRKGKTGDESRTFHDRLRNNIDQYILYPQDGNFGAFSEGFIRHFDDKRIEVLTGAEDLHIELEPGTHTVKWVSAAGRKFKAEYYFWGGAWPQLCGLLDIPCQDPATDQILLGSFSLNRPAQTDYCEILFGDPEYRINRVYFPSVFRDSTEPLMQIEYAVPRAENPSFESDYWRDTWLADCGRIGILGDDH